MNRPLRILIGCECSGIVRRAFAALGHDAWSCDLKPAEDRSNHHIVGDMLLKVGFDSAKGRRHLFADHPAFAVEYRLTERIRWANLEQSAAGPTENHSWYVWDWRKRPGPAVKGYLPLPKIKEAT